jgi:hypothetical protein
VEDEMEPILTIVNYMRRLILTLAALDEHVREFRGRGQFPGLKEFVRETSCRLKNLAEAIAGSARLEQRPDVDRQLAEFRGEVERLGEARLGEFAQNPNREVTATVIALREQSVVFAQLQRMAMNIEVLYDAVARIREISCSVNNPSASVTGARKAQNKAHLPGDRDLRGRPTLSARSSTLPGAGATGHDVQHPGLSLGAAVVRQDIFGLTEPIDNSRLLKIVRGHLELNAITGRETNKPLAHFSGYMRKHQMLVCKFDAEHSSGKYADDFTFGYDWGVGWHGREWLLCRS